MKNFKNLITSLAIISILGGCLNTAEQSSIANKSAAKTTQLSALSSGALVYADYGRNSWTYVDANGLSGYFEKSYGNSWRERTTNGAIKYFSETSRTTDYVILFDSVSNLYIRLAADKGQISSDEGRSWNNWQNGSWTALRQTWNYQKEGIFGYFENSNGKNWIETLSNGNIFNFSEVARSAEYIELYDYSRKLYIRLYADQAQVSVAGSAWSTLTAGEWGISRNVWEYSTTNGFGYLAKITGSTWKERTANNQVYTFQETNRNADYIELSDRSRNLMLRLYSDKSMVKVGRDRTYSQLANGNWSYARNSWEYVVNGKFGVFEKTSGKNWIETNSQGQRIAFTEISRSADAIILYDSTRKIYLSLQANKVMLSTDEAKTWNTLAIGNFATLKNIWSTANSSAQYSRFIRKDGNAWIEETSNANYNFTEVARNKDALYLHDNSRNITIKLTEEGAYWSLNGISSTTPTWNLLSNGSWISGEVNSENF